MSSVSDRQQKPRRQDFPFQPASQRGGKGKWSQNSNTLPRGGSSKAWSSNASQQSIPQSHSPSIPHATHSPIVKNDTFAKHMHDRMLYLLIHLVGLNVQVVVKGGTKYEGLFHAASTEGELGVVLKYARVIKSATEEKNENSGQIVPTLIVLAKDCLEVNAVGVDLSISEKGPEKDTFKIDTHISGHTGSVRERELHKWNPDDHAEFQTLEELDGGAENQWDQFAANEHLFGLQTDFDEEIYTTKLDRSSSDYKEREKKAIRIANEIARMSSVNPHIAEERGQFIDDSQLDEEDKYSSVVRANSLSNDSQGKYKPPAMRTKVEADESKTSNSTVTVQQSEQANSSVDEHKNKAKQSETVAKESGRNVKAINSQSSKFSEPIASLLGAKPSKKLSSEGKPGKPIEAEIVGTFRTFVNHEKERLQQTRQAYLKMEKDGRVAELLKFSQSFKLKTPMPADLIPILGKDKSKKSDADSKDEDISEPQKEISKPKTVNPESVKLVDEKETKAKPAPPPSESTKTTESPTAAAASVTPVPMAKPASTFKFNIKASEFKPNPTAAPFIPSSQQNTDKKPNTNAASSPFFGNKNMKRGHTSIKEMFKNPTTAEKSENPSTIAPTWPFGQKSFRHQFSHTTIYEEDGYGHNNMGQQYVPYVAYRYPVQFPGMPSMGMQQPPMQYMTSAPFVPNMQFSPAMAHPGGPSPAVYSPQMTPVSAPRMYQKGQAPPAEGQHFVPPNNFPPQGRGPMVPNMPPQMYAYPGPQGHVMVRYPTEMMPHVTGPPMMVPQRPAMDQPPMSPYIPNEQPNEDLTNDPVTSNSTS